MSGWKFSTFRAGKYVPLKMLAVSRAYIVSNRILKTAATGKCRAAVTRHKYYSFIKSRGLLFFLFTRAIFYYFPCYRLPVIYNPHIINAGRIVTYIYFAGTASFFLIKDPAINITQLYNARRCTCG